MNLTCDVQPNSATACEQDSPMVLWPNGTLLRFIVTVRNDAGLVDDADVKLAMLHGWTEEQVDIDGVSWPAPMTPVGNGQYVLDMTLDWLGAQGPGSVFVVRMAAASNGSMSTVVRYLRVPRE